MDARLQTPEQEPPTNGRPGRRGLLALRTETGVFTAVLIALAVFAVTAGGDGMYSAQGIVGWLVAAAEFAIVATAASVLMVHGHYDISIGAMIGLCGMIVVVLSVALGFPVWAAILVAFAVALLAGAVNGLLVGFTGLPSFIVTLGMLFVASGLTVLLAVGAADTVVIGGVRDAARQDWLALLFGGNLFYGLFAWLADLGLVSTYAAGSRAGEPVIAGIPMVIIWALLIVAGGHVLLKRLRPAQPAALFPDDPADLADGPAVDLDGIALFMFAAFAAAVFATCQVIDLGSAAADRGQLKAFEAIAAAIVGGSALAGGHGSVAGAALAALLFGIVQQGLFHAGVHASLFHVLVGAAVVPAILFNRLVRKRIAGDRRSDGAEMDEDEPGGETPDQ